MLKMFFQWVLSFFKRKNPNDMEILLGKATLIPVKASQEAADKAFQEMVKFIREQDIRISDIRRKRRSPR